MKTKTLILSAIIAALPFSVMAENIQGAMYVAPSSADNDHPAPTANSNTPYGRVNIDTSDQEHIATTAYVKGAYNSAIGGVNHLGVVVEDLVDTLSEIKQDQLVNEESGDEISNEVIDAEFMVKYIMENIPQFEESDWNQFEQRLVSASGVAAAISSQGVKIYTTWDDDRNSATTYVPLNTIFEQ